MDNSDVIIRIEGLGKKYSLHHEKKEDYTALRDVMARKAKSAGVRLNPFTIAGQIRSLREISERQTGPSDEEFWALKDVSFEIRRGERLGIIGRNGAGKSTLLKILSRITEPTSGRVEIRGRVASLLEVGTGFHPELTGRENIYLNGAILGMTRREIRLKFDEIVAFAEVEKFLDTPVKRYSSGMYVRLAFAVAAHLEPEILIIDEVLAVGDASFQEKCLGKMEDVANQEQRTIIFVSHNLEAMMRLCNSSITLEKGRLVKRETSLRNAISAYLNTGTNETQIDLTTIHGDSEVKKKSLVRPLTLAVSNELGYICNNFTGDESIILSIRYIALSSSGVKVKPTIHINDFLGRTIFASIDNSVSDHGSWEENQVISAKTTIPAKYLNTGEYFISLYFASLCPTYVHAQYINICKFRVDSLSVEVLQQYDGPMPGFLAPYLPWTRNTESQTKHP